jgi:hypothetical protein
LSGAHRRQHTSLVPAIKNSPRTLRPFSASSAV